MRNRSVYLHKYKILLKIQFKRNLKKIKDYKNLLKNKMKKQI